MFGSDLKQLVVLDELRDKLEMIDSDIIPESETHPIVTGIENVPTSIVSSDGVSYQSTYTTFPLSPYNTKSSVSRFGDGLVLRLCKNEVEYIFIGLLPDISFFFCCSLLILLTSLSATSAKGTTSKYLYPRHRESLIESLINLYKFFSVKVLLMSPSVISLFSPTYISISSGSLL